MHILKSYKYVYDPFQVSLWAHLIIIMTFHLLFILFVLVIFLFILYCKVKVVRYWPSKTYTSSFLLTSHRKGDILYSSFDFECNFYGLLSKQTFTRGMYRSSNSLNKNFPDFSYQIIIKSLLSRTKPSVSCTFPRSSRSLTQICLFSRISARWVKFWVFFK